MSQAAEPRRVFRVKPDEAGQPISALVTRHCPEAPVGFLNRLLRKGFVLVDGCAAKPKARLKPGQNVAVMLPPGAFLVAPNPAVPFRVIYEDDALVVVEKPAGVVAEPGIGHKLDTLLNGLVARYGEALERIGPEFDYGMVHRLDRETSGLMLVARRAEIQRKLAAQFRSRRVEKRYMALLVGQMESRRGDIRAPLGRIRVRGRAVAVTTGGDLRSAHTEYRVLERFGCATLVEATPRTGRWRQLRLHFKMLGHPVAGDAEEGDRNANADFAQRFGLKRTFLHASFLKFEHPVSHRQMSFSLPLPEDLQAVLKRLREAARRQATEP